MSARYILLPLLHSGPDRPASRYGPLPANAPRDADLRLFRDGPASPVAAAWAPSVTVTRPDGSPTLSPLESGVSLHAIHGPGNPYVPEVGPPVVEYEVTEFGIVEFAIAQLSFANTTHRIFCRVDVT